MNIAINDNRDCLNVAIGKRDRAGGSVSVTVYYMVYNGTRSSMVMVQVNHRIYVVSSIHVYMLLMLGSRWCLAVGSMEVGMYALSNGYGMYA
jgi:hypothetical protein